ncbi:MAG: AAA family ATPase, partial [Candidatus Omnitrophota bacterium]
MDLFTRETQKEQAESLPLSVRMRPRNLEEVVGQKHILGAGKLLPRAILADRLSSLILYGPPGTGKTTLAYVISKATRRSFETINAVASGAEDMRKVIAAARERKKLT